MARITLQKDPRVFARGVAKKPPETKRALGIDLGTACGIAFTDFQPGKPIEDGPVYLDILSLELGTYDTGAIRHVRLMQFLEIIAPDLIGFEDVKYDAPLEAFKGKPLGMLVARIVPTAEFLGGLKTTLSVWAETHDVPCQGIAIAQIKKHATGKGNSGKEQMVAACNEHFGTEFKPEEYEKTGADNIADAAFVMQMILETYSEGLTDEKPADD